MLKLQGWSVNITLECMSFFYTLMLWLSCKISLSPPLLMVMFLFLVAVSSCIYSKCSKWIWVIFDGYMALVDASSYVQIKKVLFCRCDSFFNIYCHASWGGFFSIYCNTSWGSRSRRCSLLWSSASHFERRNKKAKAENSISNRKEKETRVLEEVLYD